MTQSSDFQHSIRQPSIRQHPVRQHPVRVRFAPSPTGFLHLGNARTALLNWLFAARTGGDFVLRVDDTDRERSELRFVEAIQRDLRWLGLNWSEQIHQSDRFERYAAAADRLREAGSLYPCYETEEELDLKRKLARARGKPPIYDRSALALTSAERARLEADGRRPHWRFKLGAGAVSWTDLVRGATSFAADSLSDPILVRGDGVPLYGLATIVDDIDLGITHIIRGEDHVTNTAAQIQLFQALGGPVPAFAHHSLVLNASGEKFSKRQGALSLATLREEGFEAASVASLLAKLGTSDPVEPRRDLAALAAEFDLAKLSRAQPKLDIAELEGLNGRLLHLTPFEDVADRLPVGAGPDFWDAVRPNLTFLAEAKDWWQVCEGPLAPVVTDGEFAAEAARRLPAEPFDAETWKRWTADLKQATGRAGRMLFLPLRQALTGRDHGPEMQKLLPLIGRARAVSRLSGEAA